MNIKFIALLLLIPFFSGCFSWAPNATMSLTRNIKYDYSVSGEFTRQEYSGTILHDPSKDIYYTDKLLIGENRKVAISFFRKGSGRGCACKIEEIEDFPKTSLLEVPLYIQSGNFFNKAYLPENGIAIKTHFDNCGEYGQRVYIYENSFEVESCWFPQLNIRTTNRNAFVHHLKKLGYILTIPFDIVTFPFYFLYGLSHMPE